MSVYLVSLLCQVRDVVGNHNLVSILTSPGCGLHYIAHSLLVVILLYVVLYIVSLTLLIR